MDVDVGPVVVTVKLMNVHLRYSTGYAAFMALYLMLSLGVSIDLFKDSLNSHAQYCIQIK